MDNRIKFIARFLPAFFIPFVVLSRLEMHALTGAIAGVEAWLLNSAGVAASAQGTIVSTESIDFLIVFECTGLVMALLLLALLFAHPPKKLGLPKLAAWCVFLFAFNLVRLFVTLFVGVSFGERALETTHVFLWFVDAGVVFWVWMKLAGVKL